MSEDTNANNPDHNPTSIRLGSANKGDESTGIDAANESLFDALRITFRLLQAGMLVIAALYLLSGFQSVGNSERALRVIFGKVVQSDLEEGFQFSMPYPIGELVRVRITADPIKENRAFWPHRGGRPVDNIESLPNAESLVPGRDGSVITADGNIAHTRWDIVYVRSDAEKVARNVFPDEEGLIVLAAVRGGVITALAETNIDDLLKDTGSDIGSVARRAKTIAQATLDRIDTGITIDTLSLRDKIPPVTLSPEFASVQKAESKSNERLTQAQNMARLVLTQTAGDAAELLIDKIDTYQGLIELGEDDQAAIVLQTIDSILDGQPMTPEGQIASVEVSGVVTDILNQAKQFRSTVVSERRAELDIYKAKLAQFRANPLVTIQTAWRDAFVVFSDGPSVQTIIAPPGISTMELVLNPDPDIAKQIERDRNKSESEKALKARMKLLEEDPS